MNLNEVTLIGQIGQDVEIYTFPANGNKIATISIATSSSYKNAAGEYETETNWHKVKIVGKRAGDAERLLSKGMRILIKGKLTYEKWEKDNVKHERAVVVSFGFQMMDKKKDGATQTPLPTEAPAMQTSFGNSAFSQPVKTQPIAKTAQEIEFDNSDGSGFPSANDERF